MNMNWFRQLDDVEKQMLANDSKSNGFKDTARDVGFFFFENLKIMGNPVRCPCVIQND